MEDERVDALGVVVESERGSRPFRLLHGEPLVACAAWAMGEAGIRLLDLTTAWTDVREAGLPLVWHDSLCPMAPPGFLSACVRRAVADSVVVAGVRTVTDTVKRVIPGDPATVGETLDRERLRRLVSPIVLPPGVIATLEDWPASDFRTALADLRSAHPTVLVEAPGAAARVSTDAELRALEALTGRAWPPPR